MINGSRIILILLVSISCACFAREDVSFERLSIEQGLSHSTIEDILQDSQGYMWFATANGLNRYDGYQFEVYYHEQANDQSLSSSDITSLFEDSQGNFWVGTAQGLNLFDTKTKKSKRFFNSQDIPQSLSNNFIRSLFEDSKGVLWVGTRNGLNRYDKNARIFHRYMASSDEPNSLHGKEVYAIFEDAHGELWIGTSFNAIHRYDRTNDRFDKYLLPEKYILPKSKGRRPQWFAISEDSQGRMWTGVGVNGLYEFDRQRGEFLPSISDLNKLAHNGKLVISDIEEDSEGNLWVGFDNSGGLVRIPEERNGYQIYKHKDYELNSLGNDTVFVIYRDNAGLIWLGHIADGITKMRRDTFSRLMSDPFTSFSISHGEVLSVFDDSNGILWIGHSDCLDRLDFRNHTVKTLRSVNGENGPIDLKNVSLIKEFDNDSLIINSSDMGIIILDKKEFTCEVLLEDVEANYAIVDHEDNWWVSAAYNGLYKIEKSGAITHYINGEISGLDLSDCYISDLLETPDHSIWVATTNGLFQIRPDRHSARILPATNDPGRGLRVSNVCCLHYSQNKLLWIGTTEGLYRFEINSGKFDYFAENTGLSGNEILNILEDVAGDLWMTTNGGMSRFDVQDHSVRNFIAEDGLQSREFNVGARFINKNGRMYFGGLKGLNYFDPQNIVPSQFKPGIVITSLKLKNRSIVPNTNNPKSEQLLLEPTEKDVEFEFSGFDYAKIKRIKYRYRLRGYDQSWKQIANERHAVFTNLPYGFYIFEVMCTNSDGVWTDNKASVSLFINPAFYETWWFYLIVILSFTALVSGTFWARERYAAAKRRKLKRIVKERTEEINQKKEEIEHAYASLEESEKQFRTIFENSLIGIYRINLNGSVILANQAFLKIAGFKNFKELLNRKLGFSEFHNNLLDSDLLSDLKRKEELRGLEFIWSRDDGSSVNIRENLKVSKASSGVITYIEGSIEDITEKKRAEEQAQLRQMQLIQSEKLMSLGRLVSGIAHEINNPNLFINSNSSVLVKTWKSARPILDDYYQEHGDFRFGGTKYSKIRDSIPEMLSGISEGSSRIKHIVSELRDFAGDGDAGMTELVNINSVIKSAITIVSYLIKETTDNFVNKQKKSLPKVKGNYQKLEQVIINLLTNACQSLENRSKSITVTTSYDANSVVVTVRDQGVGIPGENLENIYEPFFTTKRESGGTGLGLSISSTIIKEHGGSITYKSIVGRGSTAMITLPVCPDHSVEGK